MYGNGRLPYILAKPMMQKEIIVLFCVLFLFWVMTTMIPMVPISALRSAFEPVTGNKMPKCVFRTHG